MAKVRVSQLADELAVEPRVVQIVLQELGAHVRSLSSRVSPETAQAVRRRLGLPADDSAGDRPTSPPGSGDAGLVAEILGVPLSHPLLGNLARSSGPHERGSRTARAVYDGPPLDAGEAIDERWARNLLDETDRRAWTAAGLSQHDAAIAAQCHALGLVPADLARVVHGRTVASRLRGGESVVAVVAMLRADRQVG